MHGKTNHKLTGTSLVLGALLVNIPYTLLILNFDYPGILREPPDHILRAFHSGGPALVLTWFAFAWTGMPMLLGAILLGRTVQDANPWMHTATTLGVAGFVVQLIGLLRWVFVVPVIARLYVDPAAAAADRAALASIFLVVHQFGGVVLGEHIGQIFTILWMSMVSVAAFKREFPAWLSYLGWFASAVYVLAQAELFATVIPGFPEIGWAGLVGSLLWLVWTVLVGVRIYRTA